MLRNKFLKELDELNGALIDMGTLIERAIDNSVKALLKQDRELCRHVIVSDKEINARTAAIESKALKILLMQQPVASDLRLISTALKVVTDMERIGDQARDVCGIVLHLCEENYEPSLVILPAMGELARTMVRMAVDSFVKIDMALAEKIIKTDDDMDDMFAKLREKMINLIKEKPAFANQALYFMMIGKYFEKIGDHAENIADWVIFERSGKHKHNTLL
jgi:phosphate transport system protein